jgi:hypothetical protein
MREQIVWTRAEYHRLWRDSAEKAESHAWKRLPRRAQPARDPALSLWHVQR